MGQRRRKRRGKKLQVADESKCQGCWLSPFHCQEELCPRSEPGKAGQ